ncbi:MAG: LysR family transcriptional regulator [Acidobacteriota bacterium]|nr:LysR family transcriptional regulator [Acidobacteriota bacterium]
MNIKNLDLNLLLTFDALMRERNVSRAASRLGITQPAASNALARLRVAFEDEILVRTGRTMTPTARAQTLESPVREALSALEQALGEPETSLANRTIVIGTTEYSEHLLLPRLVSFFAKSQSMIRLVLRRLPTLFQAPEDDLQAGLLNLAIGFFPEAASLRPGIHSKSLMEDESVCVVRKGHPYVASSLSLKQYLSLRHVSVFYRNDGSSIVDRQLLEKEFRRTVVLQVPHLVSALRIVSQTDLATIIPRKYAAEFTRCFPIRYLRAPIPLPALKLSLLWHSRDDADPGLRIIKDELVQISAQYIDHSSRRRSSV